MNDPCDNARVQAEREAGDRAVLRHGVDLFEVDDVGLPTLEEAVQLHAVDARTEHWHVDDLAQRPADEEGQRPGDAGVDADDDHATSDS